MSEKLVKIMVYISNNVKTAINRGYAFVVFYENAQKGIDSGTKSCYDEIKALETFPVTFLETFVKCILRKKRGEGQ